MDEFDKLFESTPEEKIIDILQNAPRGAVSNVFVNLCKEIIALRKMYENKNFSDIDQFLILNDEEISNELNDIYIEIGARILGHEG